MMRVALALDMPCLVRAWGVTMVADDHKVREVGAENAGDVVVEADGVVLVARVAGVEDGLGAARLDQLEDVDVLLRKEREGSNEREKGGAVERRGLKGERGGRGPRGGGALRTSLLPVSPMKAILRFGTSGPL